MNHDELLDALVTEYISTRPNLDIEQPPLAVFFFSCSGSGKSTVRRYLVDTLNATYVCNDEIRLLFEKYPEAPQLGIDLRAIVDGTLERLVAISPNRFIVYDNIIVHFYKDEHGYLSRARQKSPVFIIGIDVPEEELRRRIETRGVNVESILAELPRQLEAYHQAVKDITPNWTLPADFKDEQLEQLFDQLKDRFLDSDE